MQLSSSSTLFKVLLVPAAMSMAAGTIVEKYHGPGYAADKVYGAWWFIALLTLVAVVTVVAVVRGKYWREPHRLLVYAAVPVILVGGALTMTTGSHGHIALQPGVSSSEYVTDEGKHRTLPFTLTLEDFEVVTYPGSPMPMDFVSRVNVEGQDAVISMNNIYKRQGYRFYQEDYDGEGGSTLSVAHDPWGIGVTYAGYLLLTVGLVWMFLSRHSRFRRLLKGVAVATLMLLHANAAVANSSPKSGEVPAGRRSVSTIPLETASKMGEQYVLYKGRVCPLQTLAKDFTTKLCGKASYGGLSSEQVLAGWIFYFAEWADEPVIKTKKGYTSYNALQQRLSEETSDGRKRVSADQEKLELVRMVSNSTLLKIYPLRDSLGNLSWYSQNDPLPLLVDDEEYLFIRKSLGYCQELVLQGDFETLGRVFEKTRRYQEKQAGAMLPSAGRFRAERVYNGLTTGRWLPMLLLGFGLMAFAFSLWGGRRTVAWTARLATGILVLVTLYLLAVFVLQWVAGDHIPLAGGFDSMNFVSIVLGVVGLTVWLYTPQSLRDSSPKLGEQPSRTSVLTGCRPNSSPKLGEVDRRAGGVCQPRRAGGMYHSQRSGGVCLALLAVGLCQLVAMMSGSNPPVTNLMPVLNSPLLTLHVAVIMMAYALFLFVALNSVAALVRPSCREAARRTTLLMLYPAVALLAVGIMIGAVWANISWGTYWSWDPKEVWALITLIVYLWPLSQSEERPQDTVCFHVYCLVALLSVAVTYFGVNLLLGGMHAYN